MSALWLVPLGIAVVGVVPLALVVSRLTVEVQQVQRGVEAVRTDRAIARVVQGMAAAEVGETAEAGSPRLIAGQHRYTRH